MPASTLSQAQLSNDGSNARDDLAGVCRGSAPQPESILDIAKRLHDENLDPQAEEAALASMMNDLSYKRANVTECVPVASSDHVAEIVGKQGAKIKALRQQTGTYIKTPCRGDEPVFIITGRREDVMIAKQQILSAAEQVSLLRARRSLQQAAMNNAAVANAALSNVSVADAITASNLLAASANLNLAPSLHSAGIVGMNPAAALMNLNPLNLAALNAAASSLTPAANLVTATSLQNALLSNLQSARQQPPAQTTPSPMTPLGAACESNSSAVINSADRGSPASTPHTQAQTTSPSNGSSAVTPISLATLGGSRVLSRLALATGAAHGSPAALLTALNSGLLAGLPSYTPPGFNLATAKHIAQLRVPERIVGLVVGPRGATIKQIQQKTNTYILTPSKGDRDAVFEIIGTADGCSTAKKEIEDYVLSRTGMTVEQLLAQQSQVRALESFCHSAGLNINQLVASALMRESPANVDLAALSQSIAAKAAGNGQSPTSPPKANTNGLLDGSANKQHDSMQPDTAQALQSLLASIVSLSSNGADHSGNSHSAPLGASNQQRNLGASAGESGRAFESSWPVADSVHGAPHNDGPQTTNANQCSMFDVVYASLNGLMNDEMPAPLADREHDVPVYNAVSQRHAFGLPSHGMDSASKLDVNGNVETSMPERRSAVTMKSLLANLGIDTTHAGANASSANNAARGLGLGASLAFPYSHAAGVSSESSSGCSPSPSTEMFSSREALGSSGNSSLLQTLSAMRI